MLRLHFEVHKLLRSRAALPRGMMFLFGVPRLGRTQPRLIFGVPRLGKAQPRLLFVPRINYGRDALQASSVVSLRHLQSIPFGVLGTRQSLDRQVFRHTVPDNPAGSGQSGAPPELRLPARPQVTRLVTIERRLKPTVEPDRKRSGPAPEAAPFFPHKRADGAASRAVLLPIRTVT